MENPGPGRYIKRCISNCALVALSMSSDNHVNHILGDAVFHIIQDMIIEPWARCVASVILSALLVTYHHVVVLFALCLLLVPSRIGASLVAHLVLATCCVAQHMVS